MSLNFSTLSPATWGTLVACIIAGIIIFFVSRSRKSWNTRMLANAALCIALSFILSCIRLYNLPQGGAITLASMLPLFLFSYVYGVAPGFLVGAGYGMLLFIQDAYFVHPVELILDYPL
ncbi:MAG: energy-coupled thiamine transporter ThiT, partial [Oribacterium sp.]|nr:energy-coupled thiamine transporter ThiT [Oribacterium sp.]